MTEPSTPIPSPRLPSPADRLDSEAAWYAHRADQEEAAWGSGSYVDLLRRMAADRHASAAALRKREAPEVAGEAA